MDQAPPKLGARTVKAGASGVDIYGSRAMLDASKEEQAKIEVMLESAKHAKLERGGRWDSAFADTSTVLKRGGRMMSDVFAMQARLHRFVMSNEIRYVRSFMHIS